MDKLHLISLVHIILLYTTVINKSNNFVNQGLAVQSLDSLSSR